MTIPSGEPRRMSETGVSILRFAEIKHLPPKDCWAVRRTPPTWVSWKTKTSSSTMARLRLMHWDLENPLDDGDAYLLIFVRGDVRVAQTISNPSSDGASGLIVQGNLQCRSAVVGGQEIYVSGDLEVAELFWGDYNHGSVVVKGNASAQMAIATEAYRVNVEGERRFDRWILDASDQKQPA